MQNQTINLNAEYIGNQLQIHATLYSRSPSTIEPLIGLPIEQNFHEQKVQNVLPFSKEAAQNDLQDNQRINLPQQLQPIKADRHRTISYQHTVDKEKLLKLNQLCINYHRFNVFLFTLGIIFVIVRIFILTEYLFDWNCGAIVIFPCSGLLLLLFVFTGWQAVVQHKEQQLLFCHVFGFAWLLSEIGASVCVFAAFNSQSNEYNKESQQQLHQIMGVGYLILFIMFPIILVVGFIVNIRLAYKIHPLIIELFGIEVYIDGHSNEGA